MRVEVRGRDEHVRDDGEAFGLVGWEEGWGSEAFVGKGEFPAEVELTHYLSGDGER